MFKTKKCIVLIQTDQTQTTFVWFGSDFILKVNGTKPNRMFFYLVILMTLSFKIEQNRTVNALISMLIFNELILSFIRYYQPVSKAFFFLF